MNEPIDTLDKTAQLARLALEPAERAALAGQFARILQAFETLAELELAGVPEMNGAAGGSLRLDSADSADPSASQGLRADELRASLAREQLLANAPARVDGFFEVPKTVGGAR